VSGDPQNNAVRPGETVILEARDDTLALCDALPPLLRRLMRHAPFDYAMRPWLDDYANAIRGGASVDQIAAAWVRRMRVGIVRAALNDYGPDHPQAQPRPRSPVSAKKGA